MASITLDSLFAGISGRYNDIIFYSRNGRTFTRRAWRVTKPQSPAQRSRRDRFREGAAAWRALPEEERAGWRRRARRMPMTGYNAFMREFLSR
jgi:hypothetical protein